MQIRTATIDDLAAIAAVESECFPPAEAATAEEFKERLEHYANHFWLMFDNDKLIDCIKNSEEVIYFDNREDNRTIKLRKKAKRE